MVVQPPVFFSYLGNGNVFKLGQIMLCAVTLNATEEILHLPLCVLGRFGVILVAIC